MNFSIHLSFLEYKDGILIWQVSQAAEDSNSNISSAENMIQLAGCLVTPTRNVNCSAAVYKDLPTWRTSKNNIDGAIRKLLAQVEALKVINDHNILHQGPTSTETCIINSFCAVIFNPLQLCIMIYVWNS